VPHTISFKPLHSSVANRAASYKLGLQTHVLACCYFVSIAYLQNCIEKYKIKITSSFMHLL